MRRPPFRGGGYATDVGEVTECEVVDGVIEMPIGYVNAYAVVVYEGVVLVDTGLPGCADRVLKAIVEARRRIGDVHTILLTHWHPDHVGGVAELRRRSGARIVADLRFEAAVFGHGRPRSHGTAERFREFVAHG